MHSELHEKRNKLCLTLKVPGKLQLYGLYVYYVVHICDCGMLRVNKTKDVESFGERKVLLDYHCSIY